MVALYLGQNIFRSSFRAIAITQHQVLSLSLAIIKPNLFDRGCSNIEIKCSKTLNGNNKCVSKRYTKSEIGAKLN
jgi:hypothetical protein